MDQRREIKRLYKEAKTEGGVFQIKNRENGKIFVKSTMNLRTINGQQFQLEHNSHSNKQLQQEWNRYGKDAFAVEVLEVLKQKEDDWRAPKDALKKLEEKWLRELQPFGAQGYNQPQREREAGGE